MRVELGLGLSPGDIVVAEHSGIGGDSVRLIPAGRQQRSRGTLDVDYDPASESWRLSFSGGSMHIVPKAGNSIEIREA